MTCIKGSGFVACIDPQYRIRDRNGKVWLFDFHWFCGPTVLRKDGEPAKRVPGEKSPFWKPLELWITQGKRVEQRDGAAWAIWTEGEP